MRESVFLAVLAVLFVLAILGVFHLQEARDLAEGERLHQAAMTAPSPPHDYLECEN